MDNQLTAEALQKLKQELEYLKTTKRKEMAEQLNHAIGFGDLSENAAYFEAKEAQGFLEGRIVELQTIINTAKIIDYRGLSSNGMARIGSTVYLKNEKSEVVFTIVCPNEADPVNNKISADSPLGRVLVDKRKGDAVVVDAPSGKITYKITRIE